MKEVFVDYENSNGKYKISNYGNILNTSTNKLLKGTVFRGYKRHTLKIDDKAVSVFTHVAVAKHFVPNPNNLPIVNHIDEDGLNPKANNLEWVTAKENANHGSRNERIGTATKSPICEYDLEGNYIRTWISPAAPSSVYKISVRAIQQAASIISNTGITSCGRQWRYLKDSKGENINPLPKNHKARLYNSVANHNVIISDNFLYYELQDANKHQKALMMIDDVINNPLLKIYQKRNLEYIKEYLNELKTC